MILFSARLSALVFLGCVVAGAVLAFAPIGQRVDLAENGAQIKLESERRWVVNANDCVTLSWQMEGIQAVYLNEEGTTGENTATYCVNEPRTQVAWRVQFLDSTEKTYTLTLNLMANEPIVWGVVFVGVNALLWLALLGGLAVLRRLAPAPARVVQGAVVAVVCVGAVAGVAYIALDAYLAWHLDSRGTLRERQLYRYDEAALTALQREGERPLIGYGLEAGNGINTLGFYGEEIALPKPEGVYRIVAMGDSSTMGLGTSISGAYPAVLERLLRAEGYQVEVVNAGLAGYNSWGQLANLSFRLLELEPDLLIFYSAVMDVAPRLVEPQCYAGENVHRGLDPLSSRTVTYPLPERTLDRFLWLNLGQVPSPLQRQTERYFACGKTFDNDNTQNFLAQNPPIYYARHVRAVAAIAQANGVEVLFSTWAHGQNFPHPAWWYDAIAQHNAIVTDIAYEFQTHYIDLWAVLNEDDRYWFGDAIHQSNEGHAEQARLYASYIITNILSP